MSDLIKKETIKCDDFVDDDESEEAKFADTKATFNELKEQFDIKKVLSELVIKKDTFVFNKESKLEEDYDIGGELGKGSYGVVYSAIHKITGEERAIKQIPKSKIKKEKFKRFINEVNALKQLDHPNIIKLFEVYEEDKYVYLVQEMWWGGELYDQIVNQQYFSEQTAASYFKQIVQSILYCNKNKISHRDLKPENFMFKNNEKDCKLKLIDFGLSRSYYKFENSLGLLGKIVRMQTYAGTAFFIAPEVITHNYTESCDIWSAGVMLYIMLCGYPPFYGENDKQILQSVLEGDFDFEDDVWDAVSEEAKDLVAKWLTKESDRISPKEALAHPWLKVSESHASVPKKHIDRLKNFQKTKKLKKAALTYLASRTSDKDIAEEMKIFETLDKNKDGYITLKELKDGMAEFANVDEVAEILKGVDIDSNGAINYNEFIAATMDQQQHLEKIKDAFSVFDVNKDGVIDSKELQEVLESENSEVMKLIISECDVNGDGKINFDEFSKLMMKEDK